MIRVVLPQHLRTLARVDDEISIHIEGEATVHAVLTAIEEQYPVLRGTIRDHVTFKRRAFIRFFVCNQDISLARIIHTDCRDVFLQVGKRRDWDLDGVIS